MLKFDVDIARVLVVTDLHLKAEDFTTVLNSSKVSERILAEVRDRVKEKGINFVIFTGDISNGGYRDIIKYTSHVNLLSDIKDSVIFCGTILGNHGFIERDCNLEYISIQPSPKYSLTKEIYASKPVLANPDSLLINNVQFSLFNFDKVNKQYIRERAEEAFYHIGVYHDTLVIPTDISSSLNIPIDNNSTYLKDVYENIDEAVCGHIHKKIGSQLLRFPNKDLLLNIPGSMSITENSEVESHESVDLPLYTIQNGKLTKSYETFSTHRDELTFIESRTKVTNKIKDSIKKEGVDVESIFSANEHDKTMSYRSSENTVDFLEYIRRKGYREEVLSIIDRASKNDLSFDDALKMEGELNGKF